MPSRHGFRLDFRNYHLVDLFESRTVLRKRSISLDLSKSALGLNRAYGRRTGFVLSRCSFSLHLRISKQVFPQFLLFNMLYITFLNLLGGWYIAWLVLEIGQFCLTWGMCSS